ncbi:hypothetical protein ACFRCW_30805, partial [Streptomyces sp. NPDC056653]
MTRFFAAYTTQDAAGWAVAPRIPVRLLACSSTASDGWTVRQGGPVLLWDEAVRSLALWHTAGAPGPSEFGVSVTAGSQRVWLGTPSGPSWSLPIAVERRLRPRHGSG